MKLYFSNAKTNGTFSWKWFKSLAQRSDLNLVGSTWSPKWMNFINTFNLNVGAVMYPEDNIFFFQIAFIPC